MTFGEALDKVASVVRDQYLQLIEHPEVERDLVRNMMKYLRRIGGDLSQFHDVLTRPFPDDVRPFRERSSVVPNFAVEEPPVPSRPRHSEPEPEVSSPDAQETGSLLPEVSSPDAQETGPSSPDRPGLPARLRQWAKDNPWLAGGGAAGLALLASMPLAYMLWKRLRKGKNEGKGVAPPRSSRRAKPIDDQS